MEEQIIIKYVDELINDFLNSPFDDFTTIEFLNESKRFRAEQMKKSQMLDLADQIEIFGLKKKLFKASKGRVFVLDEKGIELKDFGQGYFKFEKSLKSKQLDLYQKIHIGLTTISLIGVFIFGYLNYSLNQDKSDLTNQNNLLKTDIVHYKDSLNAYRVKALLKTSKNEHDSSQTKNYPDVNN
uniref:hypothetical protein n=1 Tax=Flavobacterium sp. TaxID=239 RepID=UPI00404AC314